MLLKSFQSFNVYFSIINKLLKIFKYYFIIFFIIGGNRLVISVKLLLFNIKSINSLQKYPLGSCIVWQIYNFLIFHSMYILFLYKSIHLVVALSGRFIIFWYSILYTFYFYITLNWYLRWYEWSLWFTCNFICNFYPIKSHWCVLSFSFQYLLSFSNHIFWIAVFDAVSIASAAYCLYYE